MIVFALVYLALLGLWIAYGLDERMIGMVLSVLVLLNVIEAYVNSRTFHRHQKALEWFAAHVHLDPKAMPGDAPEELWGLVSGKERKNHGK